MKKILLVFGTRPEAIKMYPVIKELKKYPKIFSTKVCVSSQHKEMLDPFLKIFNIKPDYDLKIMKNNQTLEHITSSVIIKIQEILKKATFDYLLIQGDTTTSMAASLAAYYNKVKVGHIEAGLRTYDNQNPFPEEVNRRIIDSVSDLFFAHTNGAKQNLINEGFNGKNIEVTGNTVIDALLDVAKMKFNIKGTIVEKIIKTGKKLILVTAHRRENHGKPLENICHAIKNIALKYPDFNIVYPVHLNPNVINCVRSRLNGTKNIFLCEPLDYFTFVQLMKLSYLILTDSGGIQEEAPSLNKPVLVLRNTTERPEAVVSGAVKVIGTDAKRIEKETTNLIENKSVYLKMAKSKNPYGDGKAAAKIVKRLIL